MKRHEGIYIALTFQREPGGSVAHNRYLVELPVTAAVAFLLDGEDAVEERTVD